MICISIHSTIFSIRETTYEEFLQGAFPPEVISQVEKPRAMLSFSVLSTKRSLGLRNGATYGMLIIRGAPLRGGRESCVSRRSQSPKWYFACPHPELVGLMLVGSAFGTKLRSRSIPRNASPKLRVRRTDGHVRLTGCPAQI